MNHIVLFSGGIGSWAAAKRVAAGPALHEKLILLFTDTLIEDETLYEFLPAAADNVRPDSLVRLADGRTPWELFRDRRFIGNTRADLCSETLKRNLGRRWIEENYSPADTTIYVGMDWTEEDRLDRARPRWMPYELAAPLVAPPLLDKDAMLAWARSEGLVPPRLYDMGFPHANCGGFCVKQGQGAFKKLLEHMPDRYKHHEEQEEAMRKFLERDVAILRDRRGGTTKPLTLRALRQRVECGEEVDGLDLGGCGCMI